MWEKLDVEEAPKLDGAILLVALSTMAPQYRTMYSHARELSKYLLRKLEFRRIATLYSSSLPPAVSIADDGMARLHSNSFNLHEGRRPLVMVAGDGSPFDDQHQYAHSILSFSQRVGATSLISIGARWSDAPIAPGSTPKVVGFSTDSDGVKELEGRGVAVTKSEPGPFFPNLVVGMAVGYGMRGYKLGVDHGEPIPHPRSVIQILKVLEGMGGFEVETKELEERAEGMKEEPQGALPEMPKERGGIYG
jgi:proteasome assembly chaperone (PAC2) family protein